MFLFQSLAPGRLPDPWSDLADLGDIFLGMPYIQKQCELDGTDVDTVLPVSFEVYAVAQNLKGRDTFGNHSENLWQ